MSDERHTGNTVNLLRDTDRWLRRAAFYGPAIGVIVGWQLGFISAVWMFRDHEKRIVSLENWRSSHDSKDNDRDNRIMDRLDKMKDHESRVSAVIEDKWRIRIP